MTRLFLACGWSLVAAWCFGTSVNGAAPSWPQWRGPNRDAVSSEKGLLTEWPEAGPKLLWQAEGLGKGYSSLSIADGKMYTLGNKKGGAALVCLNLADGALLWEAPVGGGEPNCTPTVEDGLVYALGRDGNLTCVTGESGKVVWSRAFPKDFGGKMMSGWGYSESPLVDGDRLLVTPGASDALIACLNKRTGDVIWKSPAPADFGKAGKDGAAYSSIVISNGGGVKQYVQLTGRGVVGVRAEDGQPLWWYNAIANGTANIPTPIVSGDYVFCSTGYGTGAALLQLSKDGDGVKAEEVYFLKADKLQNHHGGMIKVGDYIYCGHGHNNGFPACIEMKTGKLTWEVGRGAGSGSAAVVYADGHLYFRYENGIMALVEANPEKYTLKGSFKLASVLGKSWPHPVILDGKLYLRDQDKLMCYDIKK